MGSRPLPYVMRVGLLGLIYFVVARLGLSLDAVSGVAAAVWPPTGIALAALLSYGYCLWPGIAVGAFLVNVSVGVPVLAACGIALGNTLEALIGTALLLRVVGFRPSLDRLQDVVGLVMLAAGLATLVSATVGVTSGWLGGVIPTHTYGRAWWTWWLGDAMGALVVAPLLLVWSRRGRAALSPRWIAEAVILLVAAGTLSFVVFASPLAPTLTEFPYSIFPLLIWGAVRLGQQGAVTANALVSAIAIWGSAQGVGPFARPSLHESLFILQAFMAIVAVTILVLVAVVAERRQAEAAEREQRERFEVTLSSIGDAVMATDPQGRVTFMNPVAASLTGWQAAEAMGKNITEVFQIINERTRQGVDDPVAKVIREGAVTGLANHTVLVSRDGVERPIDDSGAPIRDQEGHLRGAVLVFRDISERRHAETTQAFLVALVDSSDDAIIGKTLEGRIVSWNRGAERIYGYAAAEVIGRPITLLAPTDCPDEIPAILLRLRDGQAIDHTETTRVRKDGRTIPVSLTISPIRDSNGNIIGASTLARDITTRKQTEAEAARRQRESELLAELARGLNASLDLDTVLQRVVAGAKELCSSERALLMLHESGSEAMLVRYEVGDPDMAYEGLRIEPGKGIGGQVLLTARAMRTNDYASDPRFSKDYLAGARAEGKLAVVAVPILIGPKVEGVFYVSNPSTHPFTERDEELLQRLAVHAAIAMQNAALYGRAQEDLVRRTQAEAQLTALLREKELLLREIHHRVKNNLQIISSLLGLQSDTIHNPNVLALFQDSQQRIRSMALVHEILYQSQDLARVDVGAYVQSLSEQLFRSYSVDPQRITLLTDMDRVLLDIDRAIPCGLILNELLTNAFKYAFPEGRAGEIRLVLRADPARHVTLMVQDTGVGLPEEVDFRDTDSLGLQLVCMLAEQLEGTITLTRQGGTTFTLTFAAKLP